MSSSVPLRPVRLLQGESVLVSGGDPRFLGLPARVDNDEKAPKPTDRKGRAVTNAVLGSLDLGMIDRLLKIITRCDVHQPFCRKLPR